VTGAASDAREGPAIATSSARTGEDGMIGRWIVGAGFVWLVVAAAPHRAEAQIIVRTGSMVMESSGFARLTISGNRHFTLQASAYDGLNEPFASCGFGVCTPGATLDILVRSTGNDLPGIATLRGQTYDDLGGLASPNFADIAFIGRVTMPAMNGAPARVTAPFEFTGRLAYAPDPFSEPDVVSLVGRGRVTFYLTPSVDGTEWNATHAVFEFLPGNR
jgi:hypothetical protein